MQPRQAYKYKNTKAEKDIMKDNFMNLTQMNSSREFRGVVPKGYFDEAQRSKSIKPESVG